MPLEIRIQRGGSFADQPLAPITERELEHALHESAVPYARALSGGDAWWVRYPDWLSARSAGELWFSASVKSPGLVSLAISYSNARIFRNAVDLLDHALRLAETLGAAVFTETGEVTKANVRAFQETAPATPWIELAIARYKAVLEQIRNEPLGAIELPVDDADVVPEYALLQVAPGRALAATELAERLKADGFAVKLVPPMLYVMNGERVAAMVCARVDRQWEVWVGHGTSPWPIAFYSAWCSALAIRDLTGGGIRIVGVPVEGAFEREIETRMAGKDSGVEFCMWFRKEHPTAHLRPIDAPEPPRSGTEDEPVDRFIERNLAVAVATMERETGAPCAFDFAAVRWLEDYMERMRRSDAAERAKLVSPLGCFLGECIATTLGGAWVRLQGSASGLAVEVRPSLFVAPWAKVEGFLAGDDGDSVVAFWKTIKRGDFLDDSSGVRIVR